MKSLICCEPRQSVLDGSEDFVVNLSDFPELSEAEAAEFLDSNVLTSGMEELIVQAFDRLSGGPSRGLFKLSESMGGGKTQSMIVCGLLARFPKLAKSQPFKKAPKIVKPDKIVAFTGRSTDENVWVSIGKQLGAAFPADAAPSEKQWAALFKGKAVLILLDELAFYLVHAASKGKKDEGERFSTLTALALTNLFGAVRDHKDAGQVAVVVADLQKDWEQGHEDLARIMRTNVSLGGTIQSADNEMSKGAVSISPVDNTKDELYAILRKRLFKDIKISEKEKKAVIDAYFAELQTAKKAGLVERALPTIREELEVSYPFHFSTKHLIETFNDNPGFQKTRDVIRLMASIVRSIWGKGSARGGSPHAPLAGLAGSERLSRVRTVQGNQTLARRRAANGHRQRGHVLRRKPRSRHRRPVAHDRQMDLRRFPFGNPSPRPVEGRARRVSRGARR